MRIRLPLSMCVLPSLCLMVASCGSSSDGSQSPPGAAAPSPTAPTGTDPAKPAPGDTAKPAPDDANTVSVETLSYTLQPGDEKYYCYTMKAPTEHDVVVRELEPTYGEGSHHIVFVRTLKPEPEGMSECKVLFRQTWAPLYVAGKGSSSIKLPEGTGVRIKAGAQLLIQLHLQNSTSAPITSKSSVKMRTIDATKPFVEAGIFATNDSRINLPPRTSDAISDSRCKMPRELDVFAISAHMHKLGKSFELSRGENRGDEILYQTKWNFDVQPFTPINLKLKKGDQLHMRCTYDNVLDKRVTFGESSDDEMCVAIMYATPVKGMTGCFR